jgi:hypothetical protein
VRRRRKERRRRRWWSIVVLVLWWVVGCVFVCVCGYDLWVSKIEEDDEASFASSGENLERRLI